jgi:hypothetical protein
MADNNLERDERTEEQKQLDEQEWLSHLRAWGDKAKKSGLFTKESNLKPIY